MLAVLPAEHPLSELETVPLKLQAKEPFILLEEGHYYEPLKAFRSLGVTPNVKYTIHDDYAIMTMVEVGLGLVCKMSECPTARDIFANQCKFLQAG
ncbi:hypothetical protein C816_04104 [Oscillibacter sp. 1-3]|nr:hypothetical protein C816_04104 [Oscillibacter sp. 1-3]